MKLRLILLLTFILTSFSCKDSNLVIENARGEQKTVQDVDAFFNSIIDSLSMAGLSVAIVNNSKIVYKNNFGFTSVKTQSPTTEKTIFEAASLSKPVFAYFVMKQVEKGILDLDKPLYQYLPFPDIEYDEQLKLITSRMILSHSSGLPNWRQDSLKITFMPGTNYLYSGEGYEYLSQIMAKINNVTLNQLDSIFQIEVASQIGTKRLYFKWNDDVASNKATGHINGKATSDIPDHKDIKFSSAEVYIPMQLAMPNF